MKDPFRITRRTFAKGVGMAAAGAVIPSLATARSPVPDKQRALDHIVVMMFENRSFDNVLGRLHHPRRPVRRPGKWALRSIARAYACRPLRSRRGFRNVR